MRRELPTIRPGDIVTCECEAPAWYRGLLGIVVDVNFLGDPRVLYPNGSLIVHAASALRITGRTA